MFNFPLPEPKASLCVWWVSFFHVTSAYHTDDTTAHQHNIEYKPFCHFFFFCRNAQLISMQPYMIIHHDVIAAEHYMYCYMTEPTHKKKECCNKYCEFYENKKNHNIISDFNHNYKFWIINMSLSTPYSK